MNELDLSGVDPLRWAEVRRRVDAIKSFLSITSPSDADRRTHAKTLGLSVNQFLALVRAWREYGKASAISGAGAARGRSRASGPRHLAGSIKARSAEILESLGPDAALVDAVREVNRALQSEGLSAPSRSTIHNMLMQLRQKRDGSSGTSTLIVGRCLVKLPVESVLGIQFPEIALAVCSASGTVLAAMMPVTDNAGELLASTSVIAAKDMLIDVVYREAFENRSGARLAHSYTVRTALALALGRGFGNIALIYRPSAAGAPERLLRASKDRPLSMEDAVRVVQEAVAQHNAVRERRPPEWVQLTAPLTAAGA